MRWRIFQWLTAGLLLLLPSCLHVSSDPIEVKPIHIVMDVNLRIDRELDEFFAFENKYQPPATQAATQPAASVQTQNNQEESP